jgi:hypothetical protein
MSAATSASWEVLVERANAHARRGTPLRAYIASLAERRDIATLTTSHEECLLTEVAGTLAHVAHDL